jgi:hypothetical protein
MIAQSSRFAWRSRCRQAGTPRLLHPRAHMSTASPPHCWDRADAHLLRRAAARLRDDPHRARYAEFADRNTAALVALLELLAADVSQLDPLVRREAVKSCRMLLGGQDRDSKCASARSDE